MACRTKPSGQQTEDSMSFASFSLYQVALVDITLNNNVDVRIAF